jgi:hypothetical protein
MSELHLRGQSRARALFLNFPVLMDMCLELELDIVPEFLILRLKQKGEIETTNMLLSKEKVAD